MTDSLAIGFAFLGNVDRLMLWHPRLRTLEEGHWQLIGEPPH
jgi:hypothetical protein